MFYDEVMNAVYYIQARVACRPRNAVILGSGLGSIADQLENRELLSYADIPGFPKSDVSGHAARFVFGTLNGRPIVAMQGRFHYYEGLSMRQLSFPIYVLKQLGVEKIVVTNACGGINPDFNPGDLMLITDHINFAGNNPLIGANDERFGPRFPDMSEAYDKSLCAFARETAASLEIPLREGVYAFYSGPSFETAAEIRAFKALGADVVGMSTVPEVITAVYLGMRVLGLSCITNMATGIAEKKHSHEEVLLTAAKSAERFCALAEALLRDWPAE